MGKFLFIAGYETPRQWKNNRKHGWDDEDSFSIFITAEDSSAALSWGREIMRSFLRQLYRGKENTPDPDQYAMWIEEEPLDRFSQDQLAEIQGVKIGEFPNWEKVIFCYG